MFLEFNAFDIEFEDNGIYSPITCPSAGLTIIDGNGTMLMDEMCCCSLPSPITSKSNVVKLLFRTGDVRKSGWSLNWRAVFDTGVLSSPNFPDSPPANLDETYTIAVDQGLVLILEFPSIYLEFDYSYELLEDGSEDLDSPICRYSHLTIIDGNGTTLVKEACFTHLMYRGPITSRSNIVKLLFHTDEDPRGEFWRMNWIAVEPGLFSAFCLCLTFYEKIQILFSQN